MKTLHWQHTDWLANNFLFTVGQNTFGRLTFKNFWNFKAAYTDNETKLNFAEKSFWDRDVLITENGNSVGEIHNGFFGQSTLTLATGEKFILSLSLWEQEVYWKTEADQTIIKYQQALMNYMRKSSISLTKELSPETEKILVSSGLFVRKLKHKRIALAVAIMILGLAIIKYLG